MSEETDTKSDSGIGIVMPQDFHSDALLELDCGKSLRDLNIRYETYGTLNMDATNAILVEHALTGDAHLAGRHSENDRKPGWWDEMVGPGRPFDTEKYFIICSNVLGGCSGTTGPGSIDPDTGEPYRMNFPVITIQDMVRAQKLLIDYLGIKKLLAVVGGSMGGMLATQWAISYPEMVSSVIAIATAIHIPAQAIAFNWVGREAIMADPTWNNGNYREQPQKGLAIARMLGHITYLSEESMRHKFGSRLQSLDDYSFDFSTDFRVESYLNYQGNCFVERFDANSYLYITRAIDYFDVSDQAGGDNFKVFDNVHCPFLVVSFSSDWLFPEYHGRDMARTLIENGNDVTFCNIQSDYGHDAFLLEAETLSKLMIGFLSNIYMED